MCSGNRKLNKVTIRRGGVVSSLTFFRISTSSRWRRKTSTRHRSEPNAGTVSSWRGLLASLLPNCIGGFMNRVYRPILDRSMIGSECYCSEAWKGRLFMRTKLCEALILTSPEGVEEMKEYCNASPFGLGGVFTWRGRILHHSGKADVVADALSCKQNSVSLSDSTP
ncbi:hypothetical protein OSB04_un001621 [Centaurea solstitialis]|uniref:Uncharacterized protein n=1 Tax=Centaurea solstitialis TaxID=347529 RepID=A0AA38W4V6_9ASTR|nr:hypothetical protein OSB04_un001621 [Centaurea solstitialis]